MRFDTYMQESLFGEIGYYSSEIEFGKDFRTYAQHPLFALMIDALAQANDLADQDFLEIGGGDGTFKSRYLTFAPETRYYSVDASPKLAAEQASVEHASQSIRGTATEIALPDESIEGIVFSNELIDALPCRVFQISNDRGQARLSRELFITLEGSELSPAYRAVAPDLFTETYEHYLRHTKTRLADGSFVSVAPDSEKALAEMLRVLRQGIIIIADYGYLRLFTPHEAEDRKQKPYYGAGSNFHGLTSMLQRPYETDITYEVDFGFLLWLAHRLPHHDIKLAHQHELVQEFIASDPRIAQLVDPDDSLLTPHDFYLLLISKG